MEIRQEQAFSATSPYEAVLNVLRPEAPPENHPDMAHVHVFLDDVLEVDKGWQARITVHEEPRVQGPSPRQELQERHEERQRKEHAYQNKLEAHAHEVRTREMSPEFAPPEVDINSTQDAITHLYLHPDEEEYFSTDAEELSHRFSYVHLLGSERLWLEMKRHHPDADMYRAAHPVSLLSPGRDKSPKARRAPKRGLIERLFGPRLEYED